MAKYSIEDTTLTNIAKAIRDKSDTTSTLTPEEMPDAITNIPTVAVEGDTPIATQFPFQTEAGVRPSMLNDVVCLSQGYVGVSDTTSAPVYTWAKDGASPIWPIATYKGKLSGTTRVRFWIWTNKGEIPWSNNNIYVNCNYSTTHNLRPISTVPQLVDFTFDYDSTGEADYEPCIHMYPLHSEEYNSIKQNVYISPIRFDFPDSSNTKYATPVIW